MNEPEYQEEHLEEQLADEEAMADQLNAEQDVYRQQRRISQLAEEAENNKNPSREKYAFLFLVAGLVDIIDFADLTGIGILISKTVSMAGTGIIYTTLWLTNGKTQKARQSGEEAAQAVLALQQSFSQASRVATRTAKVLGKVPGLKGVSRQIPHAMGNIKNIVQRNPLTKILIGGGMNLVPGVAILNLMVGWIYLSYRDEKKTLKEAGEATQEALQQAGSTSLARTA